ncbi:hypothetical protein K5X82_05155 [Halosquirtibacter xylanolyticus]|uniref:hypothetical protein n=1 Tax=Halosquirtibacter xylanolyticus TaxID=3374599 RepID=UPI00374A2797|nr:hypothetical protein K5X82_05155 [Prolixibacteraceae bacterium]
MVNKFGLIFFSFLLFTSINLRAQVSKGELEIIKSELKTEKKELVRRNMNLISDEADIFWPIYNDYQQEKSAIMDERIKVLQHYADQYLVISEEDAKKVALDQFKFRKKSIMLRQKYFKILSKKMSPVYGIRFIQIDRQIDLLIEMKIFESMPLMQYR